MPHGHALYNPKKPKIREWHIRHKEAIAKIISDVTGYPTEQIALMGWKLDMEMAWNVLDLEYVIILGKEGVGKIDFLTEEMTGRMSELDGWDKLNASCGVWGQSHPYTEFRMMGQS